MAKTHQFFWLFFLFLSTTSPFSHSQLLSFVHHGFNGLTHNNITLTGSSYIQPNGILRLTNQTTHLIGHAFYPNPIRFNNSTTGTPLSFSTAFAFAITCSQKRDMCGHGLAFAISPSPHFRNPLASLYLGILNEEQNGNSSNHLFAVEFDTVQNSKFKDINNNHVGVDINSLISIDSVSAGYVGDGNSSRNELNLMSGKTIQAWIDYDSHSNQLNVSVSPFSTKPSFPIISSNINLSSVFEETMYIGFSASTGVISSNHYILGWSFSLNGQAQSLNLSSLPSVPSLSNQNQKNRSLFIIYVSVSVFGFAVICSIGIVFCFIKKMRNENVVESWELDIGPHRFSYKELKKATRGFRDKELLGFGAFGKVYKGTIHNSNTQVAVKRISHESKQGLSEFASEINTIGRLRHRNLVQLIGWCRRGADLLLVYEFMPNGSLDKYIFDKSKSILSWEQRFRIIKGVASGLLYLHEEWEQTVIHRDIKSGNVLLDSELNARLGDFGLAKLCNHGSNLETTKVVGTLGYLAPEMTRTGKPTKSSDVFAFGALLLEVVCGKRPIEAKASSEELLLVDWVWERWRRGAVFEVVDPRLEGEYDEVEVAVVVKLGLMCSNSVPRKRPGMRQVVRWLEGEVGLPDVVLPPNEYDEKDNGDGGSGDIKSSFFERVSWFNSTVSWNSQLHSSSISHGRDNDDEIVDIEAGST